MLDRRVEIVVVILRYFLNNKERKADRVLIQQMRMYKDRGGEGVWKA